MNKYFARHNDLDVAAGFESEKERNDYVKLSISNGHNWRACNPEEVIECACYDSHYS